VASNPLLRLPTMSDDLARVDEELLTAVETDDDLLTEIAGHLIRAGGKRLRPGFCIAAAAAGSADHALRASAGAVSGGVSVELVHLGSLYHDDVMDEALTRRTVDSVNARWGNLKAILGGDFLLAKASEIAASLGTEVAALLAATIGKLCEGQVRELRNVFNVARTEEAYLEAIRGKTAALFSAACRIGALVADHPRPLVDRLTTFGEHYGMAFQIVDDILDVVATDEQLGKPAGNDLVQGVYTLPVIRTLTSPHGDELRRVLGRPLAAGEMEAARSLVRTNGALGASVATARQYVDRAVAAIAPLGDSAGGGVLLSAAEHLLASVPALSA
jgi:heptaprenyl diphosphate synthase